MPPPLGDSPSCMWWALRAVCAQASPPPRPRCAGCVCVCWGGGTATPPSSARSARGAALPASLPPPHKPRIPGSTSLPRVEATTVALRTASSLNFAPVRGVGSPVIRSMQSMVCAHGSGGVPCQGAAPPRVFSCIAVGFQPLWWVCNHLPGRTGVKNEFTDALAQGVVARVGARPPPGEAVCRGVCVTSHCGTRKAATRGWCHLFSRLMWGKLLHGGTRGRLHRRAWAAAGVA